MRSILHEAQNILANFLAVRFQGKMTGITKFYTMSELCICKVKHMNIISGEFIM
jgi:hypothetical protein